MQRNIRIQVPKYVGEFLLGHDGEFQHGIVIGLSKNFSIKIYSSLPSPKTDHFNMRRCVIAGRMWGEANRNNNIGFDHEKINLCMKVSNGKDFPVRTVFIGERDSPATSVGMSSTILFSARFIAIKPVLLDCSPQLSRPAFKLWILGLTELIRNVCRCKETLLLSGIWFYNFRKKTQNTHLSGKLEVFDEVLLSPGHFIYCLWGRG